ATWLNMVPPKTGHANGLKLRGGVRLTGLRFMDSDTSSPELEPPPKKPCRPGHFEKLRQQAALKKQQEKVDRATLTPAAGTFPNTTHEPSTDPLFHDPRTLEPAHATDVFMELPNPRRGTRRKPGRLLKGLPLQASRDGLPGPARTRTSPTWSDAATSSP
ncbi:hypothetical protein Agub_g3329, partial [Astrephomene gubernaculifera]